MVKKMDTFGSTSTKDDKYINAESLIEKIVQDYKNSDERFDLSYYEKPNKKMKDGVLLVNTSRGGLINTEDLLAAVKAGKFRGVGLDVCEKEHEYFYEDRSKN